MLMMREDVDAFARGLSNDNAFDSYKESTIMTPSMQRFASSITHQVTHIFISTAANFTHLIVVKIYPIIYVVPTLYTSGGLSLVNNVTP